MLNEKVYEVILKHVVCIYIRIIKFMSELYVCKLFDQYRTQVDSKSRPDVVHMITFDRATQRLVCSCEGFHNWGHCSHIKMIMTKNPPSCTWMGKKPVRSSKSGDYTCPACGEKVYAIQASGSVRGSAVRYPDVSDDVPRVDDKVVITTEAVASNVHLDKAIYVAGDLTVVDNGNNIYLIDSDKTDVIMDAMYKNPDVAHVPKMDRDRAQRAWALLGEVI